MDESPSAGRRRARRDDRRCRCAARRASTGRDHAISSARFISQRPAPVPTNFSVTPERDDFALPGLAKIHLEQAFVASLMRQCVDLHQRRLNDRGQFRVGHPYPRDPQPWPADAAIEIAIPVERGGIYPPQRPRAGGIGTRRGARGHFQMRDDGGDLAGGNVGVAVGQDHPVVTPPHRSPARPSPPSPSRPASAPSSPRSSPA